MKRSFLSNQELVHCTVLCAPVIVIVLNPKRYQPVEDLSGPGRIQTMTAATTLSEKVQGALDVFFGLDMIRRKLGSFVRQGYGMDRQRPRPKVLARKLLITLSVKEFCREWRSVESKRGFKGRRQTSVAQVETLWEPKMAPMHGIPTLPIASCSLATCFRLLPGYSFGA